MPPKQLIPVRTSERVCFKTCRQKWKWAYEDRLKPVRERPALRFGTLVHGALREFYKPGKKRGPHPAKTFERLYRAELVAGKPELTMREAGERTEAIDALELGTTMLHGYVDEYGADDRYEVIAPEQSFQLDIMSPRNGAYLFTYVSQIDAVVRDCVTQRLGYLEHKTSDDLQPFGAPLTLDEQAGAYWTFGTMWLQATGVLPEGEDLDFMVFNFLRKALPDSRPRDAEGRALNQNGTVSKRQPLPLFRRELVMRGDEERREVFRRALNEFTEMKMVRQGRLAVYKNPGRHCLWCEFRDMCEVHETGSDWRAIRDQLFTTWDPYEDHEGELV